MVVGSLARRFCFSSSVQVMRIADYKELLFVQDGPSEMVVRCDIFSEFRRFVHGWVDRASKLLLGPLKGLGEFEAACVADDHKVDVALGKLLAARDGAIDERRDDFVHDGP